MSVAKRFCIAVTRDSWSGFVALGIARRPGFHTAQTVDDAYVCSRESAEIILRTVKRMHPGYTFAIVDAPERAS